MTLAGAVLLVALAVAPLQPVALVWTIAPAPEPPDPGDPGWIPWRLDRLDATLEAGPDPVTLSAARLLYSVPGWGFVSYRAPEVETWAPWERRGIVGEIPWNRPCAPCLVCLDYLCRDGVTEQRCGLVARPEEPALGPPGFWTLGAPAACSGRPDLFADGFELHELGRWAGVAP
ncbi:MAG: hypothetical protein BWX64_00305 [Acidobacteria bacterium ADurb.Bin051]|nr:MAG: hypothetical protein BWX64_00305 [Acidobacteria bacterium ADurb.Bin051]